MKSIDRNALIVALSLVLGAFACGGSSAPELDDDSAASELNPDDGAQLCEANPPPNARCAAACPFGYKGPSGAHTCECCTGGDAGSVNGPDEVCGAPPPNARCMACPAGSSGYKQIDGKPTCECCSS